VSGITGMIQSPGSLGFTPFSKGDGFSFDPADELVYSERIQLFTFTHQAVSLFSDDNAFIFMVSSREEDGIDQFANPTG
jgi:hypothetical protein